MKYLCLLYGVEERFPESTAAPPDAECVRYAESLAESGRLLAGEALAPDYTATTVIVRNHQVSVSDGAFSTSNSSPLVGFYLVAARDLNEAIQVASEIPLARIGCVEIRPVRVTL